MASNAPVLIGPLLAARLRRSSSIWRSSSSNFGRCSGVSNLANAFPTFVPDLLVFGIEFVVQLRVARARVAQ